MSEGDEMHSRGIAVVSVVWHISYLFEIYVCSTEFLDHVAWLRLCIHYHGNINILFVMFRGHDVLKQKAFAFEGLEQSTFSCDNKA